LQPGDEIVVTRLDHDANIAPWLFLQEKGAVIRWLEFNPNDCTLDLSVMEQVINKKTKIVAVGYASNAFGTISDVPRIIAAAKKVGALTFVDVVHYAPHRPIDVQLLDCDFLACSPYKFYGPHAGVLYGKQEILEELSPYKVRPVAENIPDCFETGTKNHEGLAGVAAAIDFLSWLGEEYGQADDSAFAGYHPGRRRFLKQAMAVIKTHESRLFLNLLAGVRKIPGIKLYGIIDPERIAERTPTLSFTLAGKAPAEIARLLGEQGIYVWEGNYYAWEAMRFLGLEEKGGAVRTGLCLYNTDEEVDRFLEVLRRSAG
jgi:cysteine desulfurase family protein (TIGR01976 family)